MYPIIAKLGPFTVYSYGVMIAAAFFTGIYVARKEALRKDVKPDLVYDLAFYLLVGALIGARVYYLLFFNPQSFVKDPISVFKIWEGGLAIHGAIIGGIIAGICFARKKHASFWKLADIIAPSVLLGQAIGRIGCFLNGCCYGTATNSFLGVMFPGHRFPVHPTQLYESFLNILGFFMLFSLRKKIKFNGGLFLLYLIVYSLIRVVVSNFRGDSLYIWGTDLKTAQVVSSVVFLLAGVVFIKRWKNA